MFSRNYAAAYSKQHKLLYPCYHAAAFFSCALFDELEQELHESIFFSHNKKAPEPSGSFGSVESSDALFQFCVYSTLKHIVSSFPVETNV